MKKIIKTLTTALLCASVASPVMAQPSAGSFAGLVKPAQLSSTAEPIAARKRSGLHSSNRGIKNSSNFNKRHSNRSRRSNSGNIGIGIGIGTAIIGGLLLSDTARANHRRSHRSDWERCDRKYRTFEWDTGMYTVRRGVRRLCPYLR